MPDFRVGDITLEVDDNGFIQEPERYLIKIAQSLRKGDIADPIVRRQVEYLMPSIATTTGLSMVRIMSNVL